MLIYNKKNCNPVNHIFYSYSKKWFNDNNNCLYCRQIIIQFYKLVKNPSRLFIFFIFNFFMYIIISF